MRALHQGREVRKMPRGRPVVKAMIGIRGSRRCVYQVVLPGAALFLVFLLCLDLDDLILLFASDLILLRSALYWPSLPLFGHGLSIS